MEASEGIKITGRDMVSITGVEVILAALYLIDYNREASWASQYIRAKRAVNQNGYSKLACGNLGMDTDTNLGSQSCSEIGGSSQCQHVFFRMKDLQVSMDMEKFWFKYVTWASRQSLVKTWHEQFRIRSLVWLY